MRSPFPSMATGAMVLFGSAGGFAPIMPQSRKMRRSPPPPSPFSAASEGSQIPVTTTGRMMSSDHRRCAQKEEEEEEDILRQDACCEPHNPEPVILSFLENFCPHERSDTMKLATAATIVALAVSPLDAYAAMSGGRMGGSFSSSSPQPSVTRSATSSSRASGYSGSSPSSSSSRPSVTRSATTSSSYSRGYARGHPSGYHSRPSATIIVPDSGYGPVTPRYGSPGVVGYSYGPSSSFFDPFVVAIFAFLLVGSIISNASNNAASTWSSDVFDKGASSSVLGFGSSVVRLSVAMDVPNRDDGDSILSVLHRLSRTSRTDSRVGIQNLTSQVALEILRRRYSISSASSSYEHFRDNQEASRDFQSKSVRERSKFEREGVSKFGGVDYGRQGSPRDSDGNLGDGKSTMAVVTLILHIDGDSTRVPKIKTLSDVEKALSNIATDSKVDDCLQSAEILWTPEDRSESLSLGDVIADYPALRTV